MGVNRANRDWTVWFEMKDVGTAESVADLARAFLPNSLVEHSPEPTLAFHGQVKTSLSGATIKMDLEAPTPGAALDEATRHLKDLLFECHVVGGQPGQVQS